MDSVKNKARLLLGSAIVTLSLLLILVVGYAQALKSYQQLTVDTVLAQTEAARLGIEQILNSGVSLTEIAGLNKVLQPIADSENSVTGLRLLAGDKELYSFGPQAGSLNHISVPLSNKFGQVGSLEVVLSPEKVEALISANFQPMLWLIAVLLVAFVGCVLKSQQRAVYLTSFTVIFFTMAISVLLLVGSLYRDGLQSKAVSLGDIVSQRLSPILDYNVDQDLLTGIDGMLDNFRRANPELSEISVYKGESLIASSHDRNSMGLILKDTGVLEYSHATSLQGEVRLSYQAEVVLAQLARILKNFAVLFFACGLVCFVFIRLLSGEANRSQDDLVLERLKPLFLGAVLMEALMAPIMPQYLTAVANDAGLGAGASSLFFTLYFLGFALTLLPAARLIEIYDIRRVLVAGILLSSLGCILLGSEYFHIDWNIVVTLGARLVSGIGQALIFIAVQGYILRFSNQSNKTQAAGIIVFCFNAGFITGAAIGALLANYLGDKGIFMLAASIGLIMSMFSLLLPSMRLPKASSRSFTQNIMEMMSDSWHLIKVPAFIRTMLLVGIPTKAALTGVVSFAVPLLLSEQGISKESIGQVLMAYAAVVLFVSHKVGPWVDKLGSSKTALSIGSLLAGLGLALLAYALMLETEWHIVALMTVSMMVLGFSHGLINAPVVTHVVEQTHGHSSTDSTVAATYRFLERFGHVSGSIVVAQLLMWLGAAQAMLALGIFFTLACTLFVIFERTTVKAVSV